MSEYKYLAGLSPPAVSSEHEGRLTGPMRYADPTLCPDCRSALPAGAPVCPTCDLLVRHPLAVDLFRTLRRADALVGELRLASTAFHDRPAPTPASTTSGAPPVTAASGLGGPLVPPGGHLGPKRAPALSPQPPSPPPPGLSPQPERSGVAFASVPKILLGLGAFCLLVAAVIFLAVSWSALGVGGRTAVLGGLTLGAGAAALLLHRSGLRIAGESLVVVALGMLALDVVGAGAAGWLGSGDEVTLATGLVVLTASLALSVLRVGGQPRLVAPQVIAGISLWTAYVGTFDLTEHLAIAGHLFTALALAVVVTARRLDLVPLQWSAAAAGVFAWLGAGSVAATDAIADPDLHQLWIEGSGWSLLLSAAALLLPGVVLRRHGLLLAGASGAAMVLTGVLTLPCVDTDTTTFGLVSLAVTGAWVLALAALPRAARPIAVAPSATGGLILLVLSLTTGGLALARWAETTRVFDRPVDVAMTGPDPVTEALLTVPSLLVVLSAAVLLTTDRDRLRVLTWLPAAAIITGLGATITLASYDVALALPVATLMATALTAGVFALRAHGTPSSALTVVALLVGGGASVAALSSSLLTAVAAGLAAALALGVALAGREVGQRVPAGLAAPALLALAATAVVHVVGGDAAWVAIPVLVTVGVLAVAVPRTEVEAAAAASAVLALPISMTVTGDVGGLVSLWLAVAGGLACASALLHPSRRGLAWVGAALLLLATWVRLLDLEVSEPEPYTLPLAAALLAAGLWRLQRSEHAGTAETLLPGLLLGTVPSLLWVLGDPVSLRALALGGACLVLAVAGAALRWSAPLLVGATVGAAVVLREIGPYAGDFPKWVWIGLAGALLTIVGITWERRLLEVRKAVGLLGRLR